MGQALLSNRSNKSVSIVSASIRDAEGITTNLSGPFFQNAALLPNRLFLSRPVEFPITLAAGDSMALHMMLPIEVPEAIGQVLYYALHKERAATGTVLHASVESPTFFTELSQDNELVLAELESSTGATVDSLTLESIDLTRTLFVPGTDGYEFLDATGVSRDGFALQSDASAFASMLEAQDVLDPIPLESYAEPSSYYTIRFDTGSGGSYLARLRSDSLPFGNHVQQVRTLLSK